MLIEGPPLFQSVIVMLIKGPPLLRFEIIDVNTLIWICNANQRSSSALI